MPSKRIMRGGNANVRPIEYYGGNSGRYSETPSPASSDFAYGGYHPVSHGVVDNNANVAGPNIGVYNVGGVNYSQQTGGARQSAGCVPCGCSAKLASRKKSSVKGSVRRGRSSSRGRRGSSSSRGRRGRSSSRRRRGRRSSSRS